MSRETRKIEKKADKAERAALQTNASELSEHDLNRVAGGAGSFLTPSASVGSGGLPAESVAFNYAKTNVTYTKQQGNAGAGGHASNKNS
jgi:hypothetical protein